MSDASSPANIATVSGTGCDAYAPTPRVAERGSLVWAAALLTASADLLFYRHAVGWTLGAFAFVLLTVVALFHRDLLSRPLSWVLLLLGVGQCAALVEQPGVLPVALVAILALSLLAADQRSVFTNVLRWFEGMLIATLCGVWRTIEDVSALWGPRKPEARLAGLARAWLLPLGFGFIFLMLFADANPVIERWLTMIDLAGVMRQMPEAGRVAFWLALACGFWMLLRARVSQVDSWRHGFAEIFADPARDNPGDAAGGDIGVMGFLFSPAAIFRSMVLFNLMFAAQNAMDVAYLWGGRALPPGFSFASYAHRGVYPLIGTALMAAAFVLMAFRTGEGSPKSSLLRGLMYLWVGQNVLLVGSSMWRMMLYVEVYSLTYTRIVALIWMGLVALGLVLIVVRFMAERSNTWLVNANGLALCAVLYVCSFVNFPGIIAEYNVRHCREMSGNGVQLDLGYLWELGPSAMPALRRYYEVVDRPYGPEVVKQKIELLERRARLQLDGWRGWTYRGHRTARALAAP